MYSLGCRCPTVPEAACSKYARSGYTAITHIMWITSLHALARHPSPTSCESHHSMIWLHSHHSHHLNHIPPCSGYTAITHIMWITLFFFLNRGLWQSYRYCLSLHRRTEPNFKSHNSILQHFPKLVVRCLLAVPPKPAWAFITAQW